jgi:hypothetical protein
MAVPNSNFDQITAITNDYFMPTLPDLVFDANPVLQRLHAKGTTPQGGAAIRQPVLYQFTVDGAYFDYEKGSTAAEDQVTAAEFPWKLYRQRVVISEPEMNRNDGPEAVFRLLKAKMDGAGTAIREAIADDMYLPANGDSVRGVNSLDNLLGDGTYPSTPTISGGIDKSTYTFWRGEANDYTSGSGSTRANLEALWFDIVDGSIMPDLVVSNPDSLQIYQQEATVVAAQNIQSERRFIGPGGKMDAGFTAWEFQGMPWVIDRHCPVDSTSNRATVYLLNTNFLDLVSHKNRNFKFGGFQTPDDQDVNIGWIYWMGNLTVSDPSRSGMNYTTT